jgi:hypothetical protein
MAAAQARRAPVPEARASQRLVAHRWTPRLAENWTPISDYFLKNYHRLKITHIEAMVIVHLMSFKWDSAAPFPSLKTVARRMGISDTAVRNHIRSLCKKEMLQRQSFQGTTNRFYLEPLFQNLEQLMDADAKAEIENPSPPMPPPPPPPPAMPPIPPPPAFIRRTDNPLNL